ncbi:MAG: nucleotidyltransferase domain-containing protein [Bacteroidia bacterium]
MDTEQIIQTLKKEKPTLRERFQIIKIALFGSVASGNATEDSDIDILFELKGDTRLGFRESFELEHFFQELFKPRRVDLVNQRFINPIIEEDIKGKLRYV